MPDKKTPEQLMEELHGGITGVQERLSEAEKSISKLNSSMDQVDQDFIKKAGDLAKDAIEQLGNLKAEERFSELKEAMETSAAEAKERLEKSDQEAEQAKERIVALEEEVAKVKAGSSEDKDETDVEAKVAVMSYLRKGHEINDEILTRMATRHASKTLIGANEAQIERQVKDLVAGSGPDGGYFLQADRSNQMIQRIFETSPLRGVANMVTTTADTWEIVLDDDEAAVEWVGEVDARNDTATPQLSLIKIPVHELAAQPRATQKMLDDAGFDIEAWLAGKVARRIGRAENLSFVSGNGSQRPKGFLTYSNWTSAGTYQRNAVERVNLGNASNVTADGLIELKNTLFEEYQANATWGMSRESFTNVMQLKDSEGQYLLRPDILMRGAEKMLLGSEVMFLNDMPNVAANALSFIIADWSEFYTIVDRFDIRVLRDPYTSKPYIRFYTTKRVGGAVTNYEAGKIGVIATT